MGAPPSSEILDSAVGLLSTLVLLQEIDEGDELDVVDVRARMNLSQVQPRNLNELSSSAEQQSGHSSFAPPCRSLE